MDASGRNLSGQSRVEPPSLEELRRTGGVIELLAGFFSIRSKFRAEKGRRGVGKSRKFTQIHAVCPAKEPRLVVSAQWSVASSQWSVVAEDRAPKPYGLSRFGTDVLVGPAARHHQSFN